MGMLGKIRRDIGDDGTANLNARKLDALLKSGTKPGRYNDGLGLYLSIDANGRRRWVFLYQRAGKRVEMGLGPAEDVSLAEARQRRNAAREQLKNGIDPLAARRAEQAATKVKTFGECADDFLASFEGGWRNDKHRAQWRMTLDKYAAPLRPKPIDAISTDDILAVLKPLWTKRPETASRLRGRIERVLSSSQAQGLRTGPNPAAWRGHLDQLLPRRPKLSRGHHAAMEIDSVPAFIAELRQRDAVAARCLEFVILTASRTGEGIGMRWDELDFQKGVWTIPAARMKAAKAHTVPLSSRALEILEEVRSITGEAEHVFCTVRAGKFKPLSNAAMLALLQKRMNRPDATPHGFRSSFRDWAAERTSYPFEVAEMALAHVIKNKAEAAYRRGDLLEKRRSLMESWASFLNEDAGTNVVAFNDRVRK